MKHHTGCLIIETHHTPMVRSSTLTSLYTRALTPPRVTVRSDRCMLSRVISPPATTATMARFKRKSPLRCSVTGLPLSADYVMFLLDRVKAIIARSAAKVQAAANTEHLPVYPAHSQSARKEPVPAETRMRTTRTLLVRENRPRLCRKLTGQEDRITGCKRQKRQQTRDKRRRKDSSPQSSRDEANQKQGTVCHA